MVDDYGDGHVLNTFDVGTTVFREVLLDETGESFVELSTAFGSDGVEA